MKELKLNCKPPQNDLQNALSFAPLTEYDRKLHQLLEMGFNKDISCVALRICGGNIDEAIQYILTHNILPQVQIYILYAL